MLLHQISFVSLCTKWTVETLASKKMTHKTLFFTAFLVVTGRKTKSMKTESPTISTERETAYHEERERGHRPWIFFDVYTSSSNKCYLVGICLHRWASGLHLLFISSLACDQLSSLPRHISEPTNFQTRVVLLLRPGA